jgi:hypothetical protein
MKFTSIFFKANESILFKDNDNEQEISSLLEYFLQRVQLIFEL